MTDSHIINFGLITSDTYSVTLDDNMRDRVSVFIDSPDQESITIESNDSDMVLFRKHIVYVEFVKNE